VQPARTAEGSYLLPQAPADGTYEVTSQGYDVLSPRAGVRAGPDPGDVNRAQWTVLPAGVPSRVLALGGMLVGGSTDRVDAVHRVETYLRTHETYRLDAPVPAPGVDAVDAFLFGSHEGFCEQFASAETVLLRAGGIPARVVTGYAYGRPAGPGQRLFIGSDAHAWVEVYSPGVGWVASDPTAGAVLSKPHPSLASKVSSWLRHALDSTAGRAVLAVLLVLLVGVIAVALRFATRVVRRRRSAAAPLDARSRLLAALGRLETALAADGRPHEPGETLSELAIRLRIDAVSASPAVAVSAAAAADALAVLARETYSPRGPTPPERASAAAALETYAVAVEASRARQKVT
jgi:transglutaminase-like putative cysteine protease